MGLRAPQNSDVSADNFSFGESTDEEAEEAKRKGLDPSKPEYVFDKTLIALNAWDLDKLNVFPHKARDGEPPVKMLIKPNSPEFMLTTSKAIEEMQKDPKFQYSNETCQ